MKPLPTRCSALAITWVCSALPLLHTQEIEVLTPIIVSEKYPDPDTRRDPFSTTTINREEISLAPQDQLDDLIKSAVPGFSLFRRSSSEIANPTTQGASLRNIGPNGAGRTLILLDGVPQNDPFGGWVYWNRLPPDLLSNISVSPGGGAGLFGNSAVGGAIYLTRHQPDLLSASLMAGEADTAESTWMFHQKVGQVDLTANVHGQTTAGHHVIREDQRGPVDIRADSNSLLFESGLSTLLESGTRVAFRASWFEEERSNGTPYTQNRSEALDLSLEIRGPEGDAQWKSVIYFQDRSFESRFSSVNADRTAETPALDQYDVPAQSIGFSLTADIKEGIPFWIATPSESSLLIGMDGRWVEGETRERFRFVEGAYQSERNAGGSQLLLGAFADQTWGITPDFNITLGGRIDYWSMTDGHRFERSILTKQSLVDDTFEDSHGVVTNGRLGADWQATKKLLMRAAAYSGFRVPTLNELYRPFRVRNDITVANADLEPEHLLGVEAGFQWDPIDEFQLKATVFWNRLDDAIANVTLQERPGVTPDGTVIPDGGVLRQRTNVDSVTTTGLELQARWQPLKQTSFSVGYLFSHTEVQAAATSLDGRELAQAPKHALVGEFDWQPHARWRALLQARYGSDQFEDDLNSLVLDSYWTCDASITYRIKDNLSLSLIVENLFDESVETGRSADGIVSIGTPRLIGLRMKWTL